MKSTAELVSDREIVIRRTFEAPRELVYRAFIDPEHIGRWWGPEGFTTTTEEMDVRPGGQWRHVMVGPDGTRYPNRVRYIAVDAPERLEWTHDDEDDSPDGIRFEMVLTFEEEAADRTTVTLRQIHPSPEARDRVVRENGALEGGMQTLARLADYLRAQRAPSR